MESLWPKFEEQDIEQNNTIQILRTQAKAIKEQTDGAVCATFSKMTYKPSPTSAIETIGRVMSAMSSPIYEEVLDDELADKTDVNTLYRITKYKFELYNSDYRFRLFVLNYCEMFPLTLTVDEGILKDISYKNGTPIICNADLEDILRDIFSSFKVRTVISRMLYKARSAK